MGVFIESSVWEPNPFLFVFLFSCSCFSIFLFPYASSSNRPSTVFDSGISSSFLRFQRNLIFLYSLASVSEGLWSALGEFELASNGIGMELMIMSLCYGYASAVLSRSIPRRVSDLVMLGSTSFPWLTSGPLLLRTEDCVVYAYIMEIGVLVRLFCVFISPLLARLRTMWDDGPFSRPCKCNTSAFSDARNTHFGS